jgi:hypothetical protein
MILRLRSNGGPGLLQVSVWVDQKSSKPSECASDIQGRQFGDNLDAYRTRVNRGLLDEMDAAGILSRTWR